MEDYEMKKTYMTPAANVIRIQKTLLQAASGFEKNSSNTISDNNAVLGRGGIFDESEE